MEPLRSSSLLPVRPSPATDPSRRQLTDSAIGRLQRPGAGEAETDPRTGLTLPPDRVHFSAGRFSHSLITRAPPDATQRGGGVERYRLRQGSSIDEAGRANCEVLSADQLPPDTRETVKGLRVLDVGLLGYESVGELRRVASRKGDDAGNGVPPTPARLFFSNGLYSHGLITPALVRRRDGTKMGQYRFQVGLSIEQAAESDGLELGSPEMRPAFLREIKAMVPPGDLPVLDLPAAALNKGKRRASSERGEPVKKQARTERVEPPVGDTSSAAESSWDEMTSKDKVLELAGAYAAIHGLRLAEDDEQNKKCGGAEGDVEVAKGSGIKKWILNSDADFRDSTNSTRYEIISNNIVLQIIKPGQYREMDVVSKKILDTYAVNNGGSIMPRNELIASLIKKFPCFKSTKIRNDLKYKGFGEKNDSARRAKLNSESYRGEGEEFLKEQIYPNKINVDIIESFQAKFSGRRSDAALNLKIAVMRKNQHHEES